MHVHQKSVTEQNVSMFHQLYDRG